MFKNPVQIWIFDIVFTVAVIAICLITKPDKQQMANNYNDIWTNGVETTGTMTKMKQRLTDPDRTIFQVRVRLEYEVNGMHYETECIVPKKEFNKLDPDGDGVQLSNCATIPIILPVPRWNVLQRRPRKH